MKIIKRIQIALFILIIGFAGGWETGSNTGYELAVEVLSTLVVILCLQLLKIKIRRDN